jgi:tripartite-type tricarboxylate transporter receptor subunit TctC
MIKSAVLGLTIVFAATASATRAEEADFYKDKTVKLILSAGVAGGYAAYTRTLARYFPNFLPGTPHMIVQSMPGGGGLRASNYLFNNAPKDGTTIGLIHSTAPLAPIFGSAAQYDGRKFNWLGSMNTADAICISWRESPIHTWQDMLDKEFIVGSSGAGSQMEVFPSMLNKLFATKMRIVSGYKDGTEVFLAMQRGEVHGRCGSLLAPIKSTRPDWLTEHKIVVPVQIASTRHPEFPDSPTVMEFVKDERTKQVLQLVFASQEIDHPVLAPPGIPQQRLQELRVGFEKTMKDPTFIKDAEKQRLVVGYVSPARVQEVLERAYAMPPDIITTAKDAMGNLGGSE